MKKLIVCCFTAIALFTGVDCKDEPPIVPPANPLGLTVEDVTCTEAFLKISLAASETNRIVTLKRGDSTIIYNLQILNTDTLILDEGLLPKTTYTYSLATINWSASEQTTTIDTTSHEWNFTIETFGESNCTLIDVAIVNDTLAYAVGEIHTIETDKFDSSGTWVDPYNIAKWNGKKWELLKAYFNYNGQHVWSPIYSVFAFNMNDIWFEAGIHWNGQLFETKTLNINFLSHANKVWGNTNGELYIVGNNGLIAKRNLNGIWQDQESGSHLSLVDIGGNKNKLYAVGINVSRDAGIVLKNNNGEWTKMINGVTEGTGFNPQQLFKSQLYGSTDGIWVDETGAVYTVGNYMYRYKLGRWDYMKSLSENHIGGILGFRGYLHDIDGNSKNDMFIAGQRGTLRHFNGSKWMQLGEIFNYNDVTRYWYSISVRGNLAIAVGSLDGRARAIVLQRN